MLPPEDYSETLAVATLSRMKWLPESEDTRPPLLWIPLTSMLKPVVSCHL